MQRSIHAFVRCYNHDQSNCGNLGRGKAADKTDGEQFTRRNDFERRTASSSPSSHAESATRSWNPVHCHRYLRFSHSTRELTTEARGSNGGLLSLRDVIGATRSEFKASSEEDAAFKSSSATTMQKTGFLRHQHCGNCSMYRYLALVIRSR